MKGVFNFVLTSQLLFGFCLVSHAKLPHTSKKGENQFLFLINSDPQMGEQDTNKKSLKTLNELLARFVDETNGRTGKEKPAFVAWNGDLVWGPYPDAFANFRRIVFSLKVPSVLVHGNHDGENNDSQFLDVQEAISGYRKLNYFFDFGQWHFVLIASQPKYDNPADKAKLLQWLDDELKKNKHKPTMLFMHYHLLPVGLSQMEYYSYTPASFRKEMLDTVTRYGNVKYVFSGHVHSGIKSSVKSSKTYRGTRFVVVPTPVFQRPFGEEYEQFSAPGHYDKRGYYLEVHVDGKQVELIGRKIGHPAKKVYPQQFPDFSFSEDPRLIYPEATEKPHAELLNGGFGKDLSGWQTSYRYHRDEKPMFVNKAANGVNVLKQKAGYGSWNFDEYQETYQLVKWQSESEHNLSYYFSAGPVSKHGAGGYIRIFSYLPNGQMGPFVLFHWGNKEKKVQHMPQSWIYNAIGDRFALVWLTAAIKSGQLSSYSLPIQTGKKNRLEVNLSQLFAQLAAKKGIDVSRISHLAIAHGTWTRVNQEGTPFTSVLRVDAVRLSGEKEDSPVADVVFNDQPIGSEHADKESPFLDTVKLLSLKVLPVKNKFESRQDKWSSRER